LEYTLIRSGRKTLVAEIIRGGEVIVRAPYHLSEKQIETFISERESSILKAVERMKKRETSFSISAEKAKELRLKAKEIIPPKVEYYSKIMGVNPKSVRITSAQKRFGSCSSRNTLCFSFLLMQYPDEAVDYVVVHELAHLVHMNHSKEFWSVVEKYMPDYKERRKMLR